jgi:hypothetical protein
MATPATMLVVPVVQAVGVAVQAADAAKGAAATRVEEVRPRTGRGVRADVVVVARVVARAVRGAAREAAREAVREAAQEAVGRAASTAGAAGTAVARVARASAAARSVTAPTAEVVAQATTEACRLVGLNLAVLVVAGAAVAEEVAGAPRVVAGAAVAEEVAVAPRVVAGAVERAAVAQVLRSLGC